MYRSRTETSSIASGAAALLQKARGHTRGQHFASESKSNTFATRGQPSEKDDEDDDVAAYLSQLSKETSGRRKTNFQTDDVSSGLSDLSLLDEKGSYADHHGNTSQQLKFMKKNSTSAASKSKSTFVGSQQNKSASRPESAVVKRLTSSYTSSALQRAAKLGAKISARKKGLSTPVDSDLSDQDMGRPAPEGSGYGSHLGPGTGGRSKGGRVAGVGGRSKGRRVAGVGGTTADVMLPFSDSEEIGGGSRFLKKPADKGLVQSAGRSRPVVDEQSTDSFSEDGGDAGSAFGLQKMATMGDIHTAGFSDRADQKPITSTPIRTRGQKGGVYDRIMAQLDTDEEDMAELIGGISDQSSPEQVSRLKSKKTDNDVKKGSRRAVTPYKPPAPTVDDQSDDLSLAVGDQSFIKGYTSQGANNQYIAVEDLEPAGLDISSVRSNIDSSIAEDISLGPTLAGLQTIDDLLQFDRPSPSSSHDQSHDSSAMKDKAIDTYQDDFESASERTLSDEPVSVIPSPSPRPVLAEETDSSMSEVTSIPEVEDRSESRTVADSYSEVSSHSTRSQSSKSISKSHDTTSNQSVSKSSRCQTPNSSRSYSSVSMQKSQTDAYTEEFDSISHSGDRTLTDDQTITSDFSTSHSDGSLGSSRGSSSASGGHHRRRRSKPIGQDVAVQTTSSLHSMDHHWLKDFDLQTPDYFKLLRTDLRQTVSHTVDPKVLETLSSFDPSALDFHASLLEQVRQTRLAVTNTLRQHKTFLDSLEENYSYTTLEDTKLFIKRQRKRRRKRDAEIDGALAELNVNVKT